jgi:nucleotide-binding universal stress UspA family protein
VNINLAWPALALGQGVGASRGQHRRIGSTGEFAMYRRILVPLDGSATSRRGLEEALGLAKAFDASLVLLHVIEYYPVMIEMATAATWAQVSTQLRNEGQRLLEQAHQAAQSAGIASEAHLEDAAASRVCDVIVDQARERRCDLIVMGTHGRRGIEHALIGSDAERVVRMSPVAVLLVKAPGPT